jgi:chemotaxis protein MotB
MARRRPLEPTENHERWLISYADFITLLFAFFVVMYSTSAVNSGSFRVLSASIVRAFGLPGVSYIDVMPEGEGVEATPLGVPGQTAQGPSVPLRAAANALQDPAAAPNTGDVKTPPQLQGVEQALQDNLGDLVAPDRISVSAAGDWLEIAIPAQLLFPSGSRALLATAPPMLGRLAEVLQALPNEVLVEGHTDNQPIRNGQFASNWDLSTARAVAVVRQLEAQGVDPARLGAIGYGENRPIADNATEEGRTENRRVVLVVRRAAEDGGP